MFKNKQFIFVGKFKNQNGSKLRHSYLKKLIKQHGGKCVLNCSKNTHYVIVPNNANKCPDTLQSLQNNQQVQSAQKNRIPIVCLDFVMNSIAQGSISHKSNYMLNEFNKNLNNNAYVQYIYHDGRPYYWNRLTGFTQWAKPNDFEVFCNV